MTYAGFLVLISCGPRDVETVVIRGSDTEVNLVLVLAEEYMNSNEQVSIAVTGGGSGTGIAALINKKTDIANSSREFSKAETDLAAARNVELRPITFAMDALCFITHESLGIQALNLAEIRKIFTGQATNWSEFGGPDRKISLYGRQSNSGTFIYIQQEVLGSDYSRRMKQMNGTSQIIEGIRNDLGGIGYVGIGYVVDKAGNSMQGINILAIQGENQNQPVSPLNTENIINGTYPISRPLYQYIDGKPSGALKDFLMFELSKRGQEIISENGYFPIGDELCRSNQKFLE